MLLSPHGSGRSSGSRWMYVRSVNPGSEWPRNTQTCFAFQPRRKSCVPQVCLKVWKWTQDSARLRPALDDPLADASPDRGRLQDAPHHVRGDQRSSRGSRLFSQGIHAASTLTGPHERRLVILLELRDRSRTNTGPGERALTAGRDCLEVRRCNDLAVVDQPRLAESQFDPETWRGWRAGGDSLCP
jgi:hypothetical protein